MKELKIYIATGIDNKIFAELFSLLLDCYQWTSYLKASLVY